MPQPKIFPGTQRLKSIPAPIGGINAVDSIAAMPNTDAVSLVNWLPDTYGVKCRKGYTNWAVNFPGGRAVGSVFGYMNAATVFPGGSFVSDPTGMPGRLFAATDAAIYDITSRTNAPVVSQALSTNQNAGWFSTAQFVTSGGEFLLACSEADGYFTYDGTAWVKRVAGASAGQIANVDPASFVQVLNFKRRAWFVQRNSTSAWYLPTDSISGAATQFNFGPFFKRGGHLAYLANWTIDAGEGIDDFLIAVGSNGDVLIYKGTDPASAATFALVGAWYVGQVPVGRRGFVQYGGDLILLSAEGVYPISLITRGGSSLLSASGKDYSVRIRPLIGGDLRASFTSLGWQMLVHPSERTMLINVPNYGATRDRQYALSTVLNSWATFQNIPIYSMGSFAGYSFAGTQDGRVLLLFSGVYDNVPFGQSVGQGISGSIVPAYSYFDSPAQQNHFLMVRPTFLSASVPNVVVSMSVNFSVRPASGSPTFTQTSQSAWNASLWNSAVWGGAGRVFSNWVSVGAVGYSGSAALATLTVGDTTLTSIDYMYSIGGPL